MNREVFFSLLALDSYNRGYGANVDGLWETGRIGAAKIRPFRPDEQSGWQDAGFYAIAYEWNGETVISYRGSNFEIVFDTIDAALDSPLVKDIWNGWTVGAGFNQASQAGLAIAFYEDVTKKSVFDFGNGAATLTGHSLGGGLAGFVGALSYNNAVGFNHMPYGLAAKSQALFEATRRAVSALGLDHYTVAQVVEGIEGRFRDFVEPTRTTDIGAKSCPLLHSIPAPR